MDFLAFKNFMLRTPTRIILDSLKGGKLFTFHLTCKYKNNFKSIEHIKK